MIWIDAQLSPALAPWIEREFRIEARVALALIASGEHLVVITDFGGVATARPK